MPKQASTDGVHRGWCFTINNWTDDHVDELRECSSQPKYLVFGREVGAQGTPHLQGYVYFKTGKSFKQLKEMLPQCHLSVRRGTHQQAANYCKKGSQSKEEWEREGVNGPNFGKDADFEEFGKGPMSDEEKGQKEKDRWDEIKRNAQEGNLEAIPSKVYVQYYNALNRISSDHQLRPADLDRPNALWFYGLSGSGKTTLARSLDPDYYIKSPTKWWDRRARLARTVILDDLDNFHRSMGYYIKMWADKWSFFAETKGGHLRLRPQLFIVTSQYLPSEIWDDDATLDAVYRRFEFYNVVNRQAYKIKKVYRDDGTARLEDFRATFNAQTAEVTYIDSQGFCVTQDAQTQA